MRRWASVKENLAQKGCGDGGPAIDDEECAFGSFLHKTFRRNGLQLLAGLIQPGVADAMEGTVDCGRPHAVCIEAQGRGMHVLVVKSGGCVAAVQDSWSKVTAARPSALLGVKPSWRGVGKPCEAAFENSRARRSRF